ncbi:MAG: hypothetical protein GY924_15745 [Planctomycetaceae bacterium]|nr:hypothetical protein [Planctomycetaceae bacterium]
MNPEPTQLSAVAQDWKDDSFEIALKGSAVPSSICGTAVWSEEGVLGVVSNPILLQTGNDGEESPDASSEMFKVTRIREIPPRTGLTSASSAAEHGFSDATSAWEHHLEAMEKEDECAPGMLAHVLTSFVADYESPLKSGDLWSRPEDPPELKDLMDRAFNSVAAQNFPRPRDCIRACLDCDNLTNNHIVSSMEIVVGKHGCKGVTDEAAVGLVEALMPLAKGKPELENWSVPGDSAVGVECWEASLGNPIRPIDLQLVTVGGKNEIQGRAAYVPRLNVGFDQKGHQVAIDAAAKSQIDLGNLSDETLLAKWMGGVADSFVASLPGANSLVSFLSKLEQYSTNPSAEPEGWISPYVVILFRGAKAQEAADSSGTGDQEAADSSGTRDQEAYDLARTLKEKLDQHFKSWVRVYIQNANGYTNDVENRDTFIRARLQQ